MPNVLGTPLHVNVLIFVEWVFYFQINFDKLIRIQFFSSENSLIKNLLVEIELINIFHFLFNSLCKIVPFNSKLIERMFEKQSFSNKIL